MAELVAKNNNASLASLNNNNDEELFLFLDNILKRAENSTNILDFTEAELKQTSAAIKQLNLVLAKSQVILVGKDIDLTDDAIKELNKVLPKISLDK